MGFATRIRYKNYKDKKSRKKAQGQLDAENLARREATDEVNKGLTEKYAADTKYRASLIESQRGGLASTIMNLGGAAGDPNAPVLASQLVGLTAEGSESGGALTLQEYAPDNTTLPYYKKARLTDL